MAASSASLPIVSVIIPVYNDADRLRLCLEALAGQDYPPGQFEVIVVDNGSQEPPRELVEEFAFCRFSEESAPGSYAARNRGVELARGEVFAFTDSDCLPVAEWLSMGVASLCEDPHCGFVGGAITINPRDADHPTAVELFDMAFGLRQAENVERGFSVTANMFTRREVFEQVGRFDPHLKSNGDEEWGGRVTAAGLPGRFAPQAVIRHPARRSYGEILRQTRRHVGGRYDRRHEPYRYRSLHFWRILWKTLVPNVGRILEARRRLALLGYGFFAWLRTSCVVLAVQYARAFEFARKLLGFASERR